MAGLLFSTLATRFNKQCSSSPRSLLCLLRRSLFPNLNLFQQRSWRLQLVLEHIAFQGCCNVAAVPSTPTRPAKKLKRWEVSKRVHSSGPRYLWNPPAPLLHQRFHIWNNISTIVCLFFTYPNLLRCLLANSHRHIQTNMKSRYPEESQTQETAKKVSHHILLDWSILHQDSKLIGET